MDKALCKYKTNLCETKLQRIHTSGITHTSIYIYIYIHLYICIYKWKCNSVSVVSCHVWDLTHFDTWHYIRSSHAQKLSFEFNDRSFFVCCRFWHEHVPNVAYCPLPIAQRLHTESCGFMTKGYGYIRMHTEAYRCIRMRNGCIMDTWRMHKKR